jgi:centromere/kinetochore protein ZW10
MVEQLDDLFLPSTKKNGDQNGERSIEGEIPMTAQFADKWMRMKFLSQTLQSNLAEIHFLWFESDLSYWFSVDEVVDLIELSFENNVQVRGEIRKIKENPHPLGV